MSMDSARKAFNWVAYAFACYFVAAIVLYPFGLPHRLAVLVGIIGGSILYMRDPDPKIT